MYSRSNILLVQGINIITIVLLFHCNFLSLKLKIKILGTHLSLFFNNSLIEQDTPQKQWLTLDQKPTFQYHVNVKR